MNPRDVVELTAQLAAINSVNPGLVPGGVGEQRIAEFAAGWMEERGFEVQLETVEAGRPNVVGVVRGEGGRSLLINSHLDTVGARQDSTFQVAIEMGRIHGRGVLDTKGGIAAALVAAASLDAPPPGDIIVALVCDEENESIGTEALLADWTADAALVVEPSGTKVATSHRGFAVFEATYEGKAAHTSLPLSGANAIEPAARLLDELAAFNVALSERDAHPDLGRANVQPIKITGGTELFVVPDRCEVSVEIRTIPGSADQDVAAITRIVNESGPADPPRVLVRDPFQVSEEESIVGAVLSALETVGREAVVGGAPFWTDAALLAAAGLACVVFGPGGEGLHGDDEWVLIDDLVTCTDALQIVMETFGDS